MSLEPRAPPGLSLISKPRQGGYSPGASGRLIWWDRRCLQIGEASNRRVSEIMSCERRVRSLMVLIARR